MKSPRLKYDGRWKDFPGENRQWTILDHYIDPTGIDRMGGSFFLQSLVEIKIIPQEARQ